MRQSTAQTRIFARLKADHDRHRKLPTELYEMGLDRLADPFPHDEGSVHPPYRRGRGRDVPRGREGFVRSEEPTSELQSLMRNSYAVFRLKKKKHNIVIT